ncbi:hypothetical protein HYFRA_00006788 [Hymenoscyphus fraxineus]|uniref:Uncharacterized protein n=1 Tax=Hymenoscyphus fraxineus TaxID=746836 RepID=A0A9N9KQJ3_9HELO|nr:hypothetical protein HYFRA_00006788 [Hymenoscyphus fraxineus]
MVGDHRTAPKGGELYTAVKLDLSSPFNRGFVMSPASVPSQTYSLDQLAHIPKSQGARSTFKTKRARKPND